jgi:hypothetical protein
MQNVDWKKFVLAAVVVLVTANLAGTFLGRSANQREAASSTAPSAPPPLRVVASSQSSDGARPEDISPQLAEALAKHVSERLKVKLEAQAKQAGQPFSPPTIRSESTVIDAQGKKLIVNRYEINAASRMVEIIGIAGPTLHRVVCTRDSPDQILVASGPCGEKIREVHGVKLGG